MTSLILRDKSSENEPRADFGMLIPVTNITNEQPSLRVSRRYAKVLSEILYLSVYPIPLSYSSICPISPILFVYLPYFAFTIRLSSLIVCLYALFPLYYLSIFHIAPILVAHLPYLLYIICLSTQLVLYYPSVCPIVHMISVYLPYFLYSNRLPTLFPL